MDPVHIYIYEYVYIYMWPQPQWGAVQLLEGGDNRKAIQEEPRWKRAKPRVLELPSDVASASHRRKKPLPKLPGAPTSGTEAVDLHDCASV